MILDFMNSDMEAALKELQKIPTDLKPQACIFSIKKFSDIRFASTMLSMVSRSNHDISAVLFLIDDDSARFVKMTLCSIEDFKSLNPLSNA